MQPDLQVQEYFQLSDTDRVVILNQLESKLQPVQRKRKTYCVLSKKVCANAYDLLINHAMRVLRHYPNATLICLGRSPRWLLEIANLIARYDKEQRYNVAFEYVAFSKSFYKLTKGKYVLSPEHPNTIQVQAYRHYLTSLHLDPMSIIRQYSPDDPLIIVEYVQTGRGLISFLNIITAWANEVGFQDVLAKCVHLHILGSKPCISEHIGKYRLSPIFRDNLTEMMSYQITQHILPRIIIGGEFVLPKTADPKERKQYIAGVGFIDRFFPGSTPGITYAYEDWGLKVPPLWQQDYPELAYLIRFAIIDVLAKKGLVYPV